MFHKTICDANLFKFFSHKLIQKINANNKRMRNIRIKK